MDRGVAWVVASVLFLLVAPGLPFASASAPGYAHPPTTRGVSSIDGESAFLDQSTTPPIRTTPISTVTASPSKSPPVSATSLTPATVVKTLNLVNRTLLSGNVVPENASYPLELAYDGIDGKLFVSSSGGGVAVLNATNGQLEDVVPTGGSNFGIAYDRANGEVYVSHYFWANTVTTFYASNDQPTGPTIPVGKEPAGVTVDPATGKVYVVNSGSNNVTVINGATDKVVGSIPVGRGSHYLALDPKNDELFVTNYASDNVSVINGKTDQVLGSVTVGLAPWGIAYDPSNGEMYVVDCGTGCYGNPTDGAVTAINAATAQVVTTITVGECPVGVAYDSANREVYVGNSPCSLTGSTVTVINSTLNLVSTTISVGNYLWDIAYNPLNKQLYGTQPYSNEIAVLNGSTQTVAGWVGAGQLPVALSYDTANDRIYVANWGGNDVAVVNGSTGEEVGTIPVGVGPAGLAYDSGNGYLYVANSNSDNVSVVNTRTGQVVRNVPVGTNPQGVAYDPTNGDVYIANCNSNNVTVLDGMNNTVQRSVGAGSCPYRIAYDSANDRLYVSNRGSSQYIYGQAGNLTVIDGTTNRAVASVTTGTTPWGIVYDPENRQLYVACFGTGNLTVIDGTTDRAVGSIHVGDYPTDGTYVASLGELFVSTGRTGDVLNANEVVAINTTWATFLGVTSVGTIPAGLVTTKTGGLFVANDYSGTVSILDPTRYPPPVYPVSFQGLGLSGGVPWAVTFNGSTNASTAPELDFYARNGNYSFYFANVTGYNLLSSSTGTVIVDGANVTVLVRFVAHYAVTFEATGLFVGSAWSIVWNGSTIVAPGPSLTFNATNGSYTFSVSATNGESPTPANGTITINGANRTQTIQFLTPPGPGPRLLSFTVRPNSGPVGTSFTLVTVVFGGVGGLTYSYFGLPAGCSPGNLSELFCTPTAAGNSTVKIQVVDTLSRVATGNATIRVTSTKSYTQPPAGDLTFLGFPWAEGVTLLAAVVLVGVFIAVLWLRMTRGGSGPSVGCRAAENRPTSRRVKRPR